jgi:tRNA G18 (ribose-2'-O)-methylase SpoU
MEKKTIWDMGRDSVEEYKEKAKLPIVVVLDNVRSLNNIGSIFRTSDAFLVEKIMLCGISACPPSPEIHKTALGAEDSVAWEYYENTMDCVNALKAAGYTVACLEQVKESVMLDGLELSAGGKYAIIAGNEVDGVDPEVVNACDMWIEIPQYGTKHSLNVSVSTGIAIWKFFERMMGNKR